MAIKSYLNKLNSLFELTTSKSTGSVKNLAEIFSVSESTIKRMVKDLEDYKEVRIRYCRKVNSYIEDYKAPYKTEIQSDYGKSAKNSIQNNIPINGHAYPI